MATKKKTPKKVKPHNWRQLKREADVKAERAKIDKRMRKRGSRIGEAH